MKEGMPIKNYLYKFNKIILYLWNVDVKVEDEDQTFILLCLLPSSYDYFVDTSLYENNSLSFEYVKTFLSSRELRKWVSEIYNNGYAKGLIVG